MSAVVVVSVCACIRVIELGAGISYGIRYVTAFALGSLGAVGKAGGVIVRKIIYKAMVERVAISNTAVGADRLSCAGSRAAGVCGRRGNVAAVSAIIAVRTVVIVFVCHCVIAGIYRSAAVRAVHTVS